MEREKRGKMGIRLIKFVAGNQNICLEIKNSCDKRGAFSLQSD